MRRPLLPPGHSIASSWMTRVSANGRKVLDLAHGDVKGPSNITWTTTRGWPIIIAGHSQGTVHATRSFHEFRTTSPALTRQLAAYLVGFPRNRRITGDPAPCADSDPNWLLRGLEHRPGATITHLPGTAWAVNPLT
jgi:hypothetical protein